MSIFATIMDMIHRICKLPEKQSFFLFGPRGTGKSTLLKEHFQQKNALWINLLNQALDLKLSHNPDLLLEIWAKDKNEWVVIDEVQKIPRLLDVVHRGIEDYKIKFALTGSSARKLLRGGANLLAGRAIERKLYAFSVLELNKLFDLQKSLQYGMLPRIWAENLSGAEMADFLASYVNTYLREEIAAEQLVRKLDPFRRFLVAAAQSNAKIINHSAIERDAGIERKQSERHFEILADTLLGTFLEPFDISLRSRQTKKAKFYFFDTGIVRALQGLEGESLHASTYEYGDLFETFIVNECFKLSSSLQKKWRFSYFRTDKDNEIDLIIEKPRGKPVLVQIKSSQKVQNEKINQYTALARSIGCEAAYLLSNDLLERETNGIRCLHWQEGLREIFGF